MFKATNNPVKSDRSVINHNYVMTVETGVIGIYIKGGILSIYLESAEGINHYCLDRGDSFNTKILPETLIGEWQISQKDRTVDEAKIISTRRASTRKHIELNVTTAEMDAFKTALDTDINSNNGMGYSEHDTNRALQRALSTLSQPVDLTYEPAAVLNQVSRVADSCSIM